MMQPTISGANARRYANYGRVAAVGLLACAGALWAFPLPVINTMPQKPAAPAPAPAAQDKPAAPVVAKVDADAVDALATRLDLAVIHAEKPKVADKPAAEPAPATPAGPEWAFLGAIHESDRSLAIISVEGHQKILAEGRTFGDTKLVSITDDGINVEVKGTPKRIDRGHRSGSAVAWVRNLQNNAPVARATPNGQPGGNLPPEVRQRLLDRGITPDQMANFRNGGGGGRGQGGNGGGNGGNGGNGGGRNRGMPGGGNGGNGGGDQRGGDFRGGLQAPRDDAVGATTTFTKQLPAGAKVTISKTGSVLN